jgi:hypothetical protein
LFRFQDTKVYRRGNGNFTKSRPRLDIGRPRLSATCLNRPPCFSRRRPLCARYGLNLDIEVDPKTFTEAEVAIAQAAAILLAWESSILISATGRARLNK